MGRYRTKGHHTLNDQAVSLHWCSLVSQLQSANNINKLCYSVEGNNRRQNELRHFALNGLFDVFRTSKGEKITFPPPSPPCNVVPLFELPLENKNTSQLWMEGTGEGCGFLSSRSYPIWVQCLKNFVADCLNRKSGHTSLRKLIRLMSSCWDVQPPLAFYLLCLTSSCLLDRIWRFRYFQCVTFRVTPIMPWHCAMWRVAHDFLFSPLSKQSTKWIGQKTKKISRQ